VEFETAFRKTSEQEDADAQDSLGAGYYNGQGIPQDIIAAFALIKLAESKDRTYSSQLSTIRGAMISTQIVAGLALALKM